MQYVAVKTEKNRVLRSIASKLYMLLWNLTKPATFASVVGSVCKVKKKIHHNVLIYDY